MRASGLAGGLEEALLEYVGAAGRLLQADVVAGAEVELELCAQRGRARSAFYSYQPLTADFIAQRESELARLPEHRAALGALAGFDGLGRYLAGAASGALDGREAGIPTRRGRAADAHEGSSARAGRALQALLADVFADQTDFELRPERLTSGLARLECCEPPSGGETVTLLATLHGVAICSEEIRLTSGLTIALPDALMWAPQAAREAGAQDATGDTQEQEHLLVALTCEDPGELHEVGADGPVPVRDAEERAIAHGREVLADLLRALRLFGDGRVTLGALAWTRTGREGRWSAVPLGLAGRPHGMLVIAAEQEDELRAFCNLVSRRAPHRNELAWALRRFELGCERPSPYEGLSDHLLALRALLEPEGPSSGRLVGRIAALCAAPHDRAKLTARMTKAQALERAIVEGTASERASSHALARDVADHLRALLRDVVCGHLSSDLTLLADELLSREADGDSDSGQHASSAECGSGDEPSTGKEQCSDSEPGASKEQRSGDQPSSGNEPRSGKKREQEGAGESGRKRRSSRREALPAQDVLVEA